MNRKILIGLLTLVFIAGNAMADNWPRHSAVNPVTTALYVPDNTVGQQATVKYYPREQTGDLWKTNSKTLTMPANAHIRGLAVSPDGHTLYAGLTYQNKAGEILAYILDAEGMPVNNTASKTYHVPSQYTTSGLGGIAADENYLYAVDAVVGDVHIFNVATKTHYLLSASITGDKPSFPQANLYDIVVSPHSPFWGAQNIFISQKNDQGKVYSFSAINNPNSLYIVYNGVISPLFLPTDLSLSNNNKYLAVSVNGTDGKDAIIYDISGALSQSYFNDTGKRAVLTSGNYTNEGAWTTIGFTPDNQQVIFSNKHGTNYKLFKQQISNGIFGTSTTVAPWQTINFSPEGLIIDPAGKSVAATKSGDPNKQEFALATKIIAPIIESITPNETMVGAGPITATIKGKNFFSSNYLKFYVSIQSDNEEIKGTDINVVSSTQMTAKFAAFPKAGIKNVYAVNTDGLNVVSGQKDSLFTVQFTKPTLKGLATQNVKPDGILSNPGVLSWSWSLDPEDQGQTKFQLEDKDGKLVYNDPFWSLNMAHHEDLVADQPNIPYNMPITRQAVVYGNGVSKSSGLVTAYTGAGIPIIESIETNGTDINVKWNENNNASPTKILIYKKIQKAGEPIPPIPVFSDADQPNSTFIYSNALLEKIYKDINGTFHLQKGDKVWYALRAENGSADLGRPGIKTPFSKAMSYVIGTITSNEPPSNTDFMLISPSSETVPINPSFQWQAAADKDDASADLKYVVTVYSATNEIVVTKEILGLTNINSGSLGVELSEGAYKWNATVTDGKSDPVASINGPLVFIVIKDNGLTPEVKSTVPTNNEKDVNLSQDIEITFSEQMDKKSIGFGTIKPADQSKAIKITGQEWTNYQTKLIIKHKPLLANTEYTVKIDAADLYGHNIPDPYVWSFTTGAGGDIESKITKVSIVRDADTTGASITLSWQKDPSVTGVNIYTYSPANKEFSANAINWPDQPEFPNVEGLSQIDFNQIGTGTAKYYKIVPTGTSKASIDFSKNIIGKFDIPVGPEKNMFFISIPLEPTGVKTSSIEDVFGKQAGTDLDCLLVFNFDKVVLEGSQYNPDNQTWVAASELDTFADDNITVAKINNIEPGKAYGYLAANPKNITIVGKVKENALENKLLYGGTDKLIADWLGSPFPISLPIANAGLDGTSAGESIFLDACSVIHFNSDGDSIDPESGAVDAEKGVAMHTPNGWKTGSGLSNSELKLIPGKGYMFNDPKTNYTWTVNKPIN